MHKNMKGKNEQIQEGSYKCREQGEGLIEKFTGGFNCNVLFLKIGKVK